MKNELSSKVELPTIKKIKATSERARNSKDSLDYNMGLLERLFNKSEYSCVICGHCWFEFGSTVEVNHMEHEGHERIKPIVIFVGEFIDQLNVTWDDDYRRNGLTITDYKLSWYSQDNNDDDDIEYFSLTEISIKYKRWILDNLDKFLENYLKKVEEVSKDYSEIEEMANNKINKILEVLKQK